MNMPRTQTRQTGEIPWGSTEDMAKASYLSHELRAPLTSIHSALLMLKEGLGDRLDENSRRTLALALKNASRLSSLIDDILDHSKLQAGKMTLNRRPEPPASLIQEAVDGLMPWAISKGVRLLRVESDEPLPRAAADPQRTVQVLTNLVSNAIKFTLPGGRVHVSAKAGRGEHAGTVVFSVADSGPGVPPQDRERIFQCFEQSVSEGRKISKGTGLGLTLAKAMVELQGGRIWVEGWRGLGATFRFTIPITREDLSRPVKVYPKPLQYHGILLDVFRRLNAFLAFFSI